MKLWMTSLCQPSVVCDSNQALLARSSRTTARVSQSQRRRAGIMLASDSETCGHGWLQAEEAAAKAAARRPHSEAMRQIVAWAAVLSISARASLQRSQIAG